MGQLAQLSGRAPGVGARAPRARRGLALMSALFAMLVVGVLGVAMFSLSYMANKGSANQVSAGRALLVAEWGAAHALHVIRDSLANVRYTQLIRGNDNLPNNTDDGLLTGMGLSSNINVPKAGRLASGGRFFVKIVDDPADGDIDATSDRNSKVMVQCTGTTPDGAKARVDVVVGAILVPAFAVDGNLTINTTTGRLTGGCSDLHANGNIDITGTVTTSGPVSTSGTVTGAGIIRDATTGLVKLPETLRPKIAIPDMNPMDHCGTAGYTLQANGFVLRKSDNTLHDATSLAKFGWKRSTTAPYEWEMVGSQAVDGSFCAYGDVKMTGSMGTAAAPLKISLFATGSVYVAGSPFLVPFNEDGYSVIAGGDLSLNGKAEPANENFEGLFYAENQCDVSGNPRVTGQIICKNKPQTLGADNIVTNNSIAGNVDISHGCGSTTLSRRRVMYWGQANS